mmetsp:Transcript_27560/g.64232  ORF Transcript_27560/g.64232 Transcript_27560/m.64232 type:complete len:93 (-) Transcript_27560:1149-1427(-)
MKEENDEGRAARAASVGRLILVAWGSSQGRSCHSCLWVVRLRWLSGNELRRGDGDAGDDTGDATEIISVVGAAARVGPRSSPPSFGFRQIWA